MRPSVALCVVVLQSGCAIHYIDFDAYLNRSIGRSLDADGDDRRHQATGTKEIIGESEDSFTLRYRLVESKCMWRVIVDRKKNVVRSWAYESPQAAEVCRHQLPSFV